MKPGPDQQRHADAYHAARSALKELGLDEAAIGERLKELADKCGDLVSVELWKPYGGARSFDELDQFERGQEMRQEYDELTYQLRSLMNNVLEDASLSADDRASAITTLADEFASRADAIPAAVDAELDAPVVMAGMAETRPLNRAERRRLARSGASPTAQAAKDAPRPGNPGSFRAFKEGQDWRWFAVYSNHFYDKTGERFPDQAHKDFVSWVDAAPAERMPELWDWHTPVGLAVYGGKDARRGMGRADFVDYQDGLAIAAGAFYPEFAATAQLYADKKDLGVSHGYEYAKWAKGADGDYAHYFTFEISPLPRVKAANEITLFLPDDGTKESLMQLRADKREYLVGIHGEAKVKAIEAALTTAATTASKDTGISFKDLEEALDSVPPAATPAAPETTVPPVAAAAETAGGLNEEAIKAFKDAIAASFAPIETRLKEFTDRLEKLEKSDDEKIAANFQPRNTPAGTTPSTDPSNIVNANRAEVRQALKANEEGGLDGIPDFLAPYFGKDGFGLKIAEAAAKAATGV